MTTSYKMRSMPTANCHVEFITDFGVLKEVRLVSYHTAILSVKYHGTNQAQRTAHRNKKGDVPHVSPLLFSRTTEQFQTHCQYH